MQKDAYLQKKKQGFWLFRKKQKEKELLPDRMTVTLPPDKAAGALVFETDATRGKEMYRYRFPKGRQAGEEVMVKVVWQSQQKAGDSSDSESGDGGP
eukprot:CAMPEP_0173444956 /NCGR_PEP_ID=MMETSP1357-20121228/33314_1 /TAXON_ID=77926 /ORGANISM="Hemiselmis rufescens, Strain PCC563" /LENGTH=96 /DNA_ID=CAMNT_0014411069 /DNA_START=11 /DNA_END=297 /DNA_ORIENTATION=-